MGTGTEAEFPPGAFIRVDESDDAQFYAPPRLVTHIDDAAIEFLSLPELPEGTEQASVEVLIKVRGGQA